ncbi:MAG: hypothetical protein H6R10_743 [Rhodocyclaceae bacterium]|nr:hypothetical protein [Rhodocyclaceae bacterium]
MQLPITIGLHRSFFLGAGLVGAPGLAVVAILLPPWQPWIKGLLVAGIAGLAAISWRLRMPKVTAVRLFGDGRMAYRQAGGEEFLAAELLAGATVHPWLTVFRLKSAESTTTVAVLPDSTTGEEFRRLRVWLRWKAEFSPGSDAA